MGRGRCAGTGRGVIGRRPPRPPGVSCPASALPLGPLEQPGLFGVPGPWGVGSPFPAGPTGGPGGPVPRGWILVGLHRQPLGPLRVPPPRLLRGRPPGSGGVAGTGHATGTSVPSLQGCGRPLPCRPPGRRRAPCAKPGVPALPRLCSTCLHTGGISLALCPPRRGERHRLSDGALRRWVEGQVGQWNRVWRQRAARGRRIEGSCRGRGSETLDGLTLRVCLQPLLPVRGADLAVGLARPSHSVEGL